MHSITELGKKILLQHFIIMRLTKALPLKQFILLIIFLKLCWNLFDKKRESSWLEEIEGILTQDDTFQSKLKVVGSLVGFFFLPCVNALNNHLLLSAIFLKKQGNFFALSNITQSKISFQKKTGIDGHHIY